MKPDFMDRIEKIIEEVRTRTCIDKIDTEVLDEILQARLVEYYNESYTYVRSLEEDVDSAYDEGYALGYSEGRSDGHSAGYDDYDDGYDYYDDYEDYYDGYDDDGKKCRLNRMRLEVRT